MKFTPLTNTWFIGLFNLLCQYFKRGNWKPGERMCAFVIYTDKATSPTSSPKKSAWGRGCNITAKVWCANISGNETTPPQTERQSSFFPFKLPLPENLAPLSWPIRRKVTCSSVPALYVCYKHFLRFLICSIDWHRQLWLARLNIFILILERHSDKTRWTGFHTFYNCNLGQNKMEQ